MVRKEDFIPVDIERLRRQFGENSKALAKAISNPMFKNISDEEFDMILQLKDTPLGVLIIKIQNEIFQYYVEKLISELQLSAQANKNVDAGIYGGILEGIHESSLRTLCEVARRRRKNREKEESRDKAKLQTNTVKQARPRL